MKVRAIAKTLKEYETMYEDRNNTILAAFKSGGYTMKAIADHFSLHYSSVSKIIKLSSSSRLDPVAIYFFNIIFGVG